MNKSRDGITSQKIDCESFVIFWISTFSKRIQIIANTDVRGSDAIKAPNRELRFAISLTTTMMIADISTFRA